MPKKPSRKPNPRNRRVNVYFTAEEYLQLEERARAHSSTMTAILRQNFKDSQAANPPETPRRRLATRRREGLAVAINSLAVESARIGNNLNQLARQANSAIVPIDAAELRRVLMQVMTIHETAVRYLSQTLE